MLHSHSRRKISFVTKLIEKGNENSFAEIISLDCNSQAIWCLLRIDFLFNLRSSEMKTIWPNCIKYYEGWQQFLEIPFISSTAIIYSFHWTPYKDVGNGHWTTHNQNKNRWYFYIVCSLWMELGLFSLLHANANSDSQMESENHLCLYHKQRLYLRRTLSTSWWF